MDDFAALQRGGCRLSARDPELRRAAAEGQLQRHALRHQHQSPVAIHRRLHQRQSRREQCAVDRGERAIDVGGQVFPPGVGARAVVSVGGGGRHPDGAVIRAVHQQVEFGIPGQLAVARQGIPAGGQAQRPALANPQQRDRGIRRRRPELDQGIDPARAELQPAVTVDRGAQRGLARAGERAVHIGKRRIDVLHQVIAIGIVLGAGGCQHYRAGRDPVEHDLEARIRVEPAVIGKRRPVRLEHHELLRQLKLGRLGGGHAKLGLRRIAIAAGDRDRHRGAARGESQLALVHGHIQRHAGTVHRRLDVGHQVGQRRVVGGAGGRHRHGHGSAAVERDREIRVGTQPAQRDRDAVGDPQGGVVEDAGEAQFGDRRVQR